MDEWLLGKKSYLRMNTLMTYEPGIRGVVMSIPEQVQWAGRTVKFGKYGPMDVVMASKHLDGGMKETIMANLMQKHQDLPASEAVVMAQDEFQRIATGRQPWYGVGSRFPITSPMARSPVSIRFEPKLNKMGDMADYIYLGELLQRSTWGDFDFDLYMISLAKHYKGTEAIADLLTVGSTDGAPRIYQGTPAFMYATGQEVYGSGTALGRGDYTTLLRGIRGKPDGIYVPKAYRLRPVDKGTGQWIQTMGVSRDTK